MLTYQRYKLGRNWAVYEDDDLLCVTVYKKGALAVIDRIERGAKERRMRPQRSPTQPEPYGSPISN